MNRRHFLQAAQYSALAGTAGLTLGGLGRMATAATGTLGDDYKAVVCLFMHGGNDGNNMVVPFDDDAQGYRLYARGRTPVLALPREQLLPINLTNSARKYALHPAMGGMQQLINSGHAAVVANVGTLTAPLTKPQWEAGNTPRPPNLFSHADQQAEWHTASPDGNLRTGWAGRLAELQAATNGVNNLYSVLSMSGNTLWGTGQNRVSYSVSPSGNFGFDFYDPANAATSTDPVAKAVDELLKTRRDHPLEQHWLNVMTRSIDNQRVLTQAIASSRITATFPDTGIGSQLRMVARLLQARSSLGLKRQAFFVSMGGFDTHGEDQLDDQTELLGNMSAAVASFYAALTELGMANNVVLYTASDFSRHLVSNGQGSDHAWGNHHLVVGGAVKGGQLVGKFPDLTINGADDIDRGSFIPTTAVDQLAATIASWMGVSNTELDSLFPLLGRFAQRNLGFMA